MHEHSSLALAQRCSGVAAPSPLFSAMLNYRYQRGVHGSCGECETASIHLAGLSFLRKRGAHELSVDLERLRITGRGWD